jgi:hypothetical protein
VREEKKEKALERISRAGSRTESTTNGLQVHGRRDTLLKGDCREMDEKARRETTTSTMTTKKLREEREREREEKVCN